VAAVPSVYQVSSMSTPSRGNESTAATMEENRRVAAKLDPLISASSDLEVLIEELDFGDTFLDAHHVFEVIMLMYVLCISR
jgi:hypothetical protein